MKLNPRIIQIAAFCFAIVSAHAQVRPGPGGPPRPPRFSGSVAKFFGENSSFSGTMEAQIKGSSSDEVMTVPGKIAVSEGKSRWEPDMTQIKGGKMPPEMVAQMKSMGMDKMVMISRPDKKLSYMIYPNLQAHAEMAADDPEAGEKDSDFTLETTELGREIVDGHPCVKNKAVVTDTKGNRHEATIWNATDLRKFPVKIEQMEQGTLITMLFKDVQLTKPDPKVFEPPAESKKYDNMQAMMQEVMTKRFGGAPPPPPPSERPPQ